MLRLHYAPGTISITVALTLEETGTPYEPVRLDFSQGDQRSDAYLALNPKGRVPLLETPHGLLTESVAILEYIAPSLIPVDPFKAARMRETIQYLSSTMHVAHAHKMRGARWATEAASFEDMRGKVAENIAASCAYLEDRLTLDPWVVDDQFTLADPYLFLLMTWVPGDGVDRTAYPKLQAHFERMEARDSVKAVRAKGML